MLQNLDARTQNSLRSTLTGHIAEYFAFGRI
jgi:hypothetical protein